MAQRKHNDIADDVIHNVSDIGVGTSILLVHGDSLSVKRFLQDEFFCKGVEIYNKILIIMQEYTVMCQLIRGIKNA